jgi:hypothetical protein
LAYIILLLFAAGLHAQTAPPKRYDCIRAIRELKIDGRLDESAWKKAPWSDYFIDIEGEHRPRPRFRTRMKMLWDDKYLYVGAELEEPEIWGTLTAHDSVIFRDNDFEIFLNPSGDSLNYFEFEINALNTGWDLFLNKPYRQQGKADNSWEIPGLRTAVQIEGSLNDPRRKDRRWWVEMAFPWESFRERSGFARPKDGQEWRINFSRVEWLVEVVDGKYKKLPVPEDNWVWSPQGVINMHVPDKWGFVRFVSR